jgi:hypothetical protein
MRKFDTCFFERYAQITLETVLGDEYADLVNEDRPDLQKPDKSLGIEVTRAMEPKKDAALTMLKEMAGFPDGLPGRTEEWNMAISTDKTDCHTEHKDSISATDHEEIRQIVDSGYGYGLQGGRYVGHLEYEYWSLALPLRRIIESKIRKVASGFYGEFSEYGLYIFTKDDLTHEEAVMTMEYASELQRHLDVKYSKMYLSQIDRLYVCDLASVDRTDHRTTLTSYDISQAQCKEFFVKALMDRKV